jgi:GTP-binding protein Era
MMEKKHKSGFVNIVGNPNVGKSTLMNILVGERVSIITSKAQTTRHRILGIVNTDDMQIVYSDTPGVLTPNYKLQESMLNFSNSALGDADVLLYVTDVVETVDKNEAFLQKVQNIDCPVLLIINKIDLSNQADLEKMVALWKELLPKAEIIPVSAQSKFNVDYIKRRIEDLMPESPPYFEKDALTDKPARFFVTEIIREKILLYYQKEIPYACEVVVELFKEEAELIHIKSLIIVERDSQKGIIIGHQGQALKKVGAMARKTSNAFLVRRFFLEMFVKVERIGETVITCCETLVISWINNSTQKGKFMGNIVAIVGRPNVGKSTLFNRLTQTRQAIVDDEAGTTRDRNYGKVEWTGKKFSLIDTGGWVVNSDDIFEEEINKQVHIAIEEADVILFVVDVLNGITDLDTQVAQILRRSKKPLVLVANKADNFDLHYSAAEFYAFGLGDPFCVSAINGSGSGDLLDAIIAKFKEEKRGRGVGGIAAYCCNWSS